MESPISAVGFSNLDKDTQLEAIVSSILDNPTKQVATRKHLSMLPITPPASPPLPLLLPPQQQPWECRWLLAKLKI